MTPRLARTALLLLSWSSAAQLALATTWTVDLAGGPGAQFTQIADAIAAASDGDVIVVRPGLYNQFSLDKGLEIRAEPGAAARAVVRLQNLASSQRASIRGLQVVTLHVTNNLGPVVLEQLSIYSDPALIPFSSSEHLRIDACADVRVQRSNITSPGGQRGMEAVYVFDARVEFVECTFSAQAGKASATGDGGKGGHGLLVDDHARVHFVRSSTLGGVGGAASGAGAGGEGGDGIHVAGASEVIVAGLALDSVVGGAGGAASSCALSGRGGDGIELVGSCELRTSSVTLAGGASCSLSGLALESPLGTVVTPLPPDPVLTVTPPPSGSSMALFTLHAAPGTSAELFLGRRTLLSPSVNTEIELLAQHARRIDFGVVPASGVVQRSVKLPPNTFVVGQVDALLSAGDFRRTNSCVVFR